MNTVRASRTIPADAVAVPAGVVGVRRPAARTSFSVIASWAGGAVLFFHGLIHLMGVQLLWKLGQPGELRYAEMSPVPGSAAGLAVGVVWLASTVLFVLAAWLLITGRARWRAVALAAVALSVPVLGPSASMASVGLAVDAVVLLVVVLTPAFPRRQPNQPSQES